MAKLPAIRRRVAFRHALLLGAGFAMAGPARAAAVDDARVATLARVALLLAEAAEGELARVESVLRTAAATLEPGGAARPPLAALDRAVRAASAALGIPVAALDALLGQLANSAVAPGTPLPASPAGEIAADALDTRAPALGIVALPTPALALAVPAAPGADGRARAVLVATLPASELAARLAAALERDGTMEAVASAQLVGSLAPGGAPTTLAWIRPGPAPLRLDLPDAPAASFEARQLPDGQPGTEATLLLASQRLTRVPRCAIVLAATPAASSAASPPPATPAASGGGPAPAGRQTGLAALLAAVGLGAAGLGMALGTALARRGRAAGHAGPSPAELEARQALAELRAICDTIPVGLALLDVTGRVLSANTRLAAFAGLPGGALAGRMAADVLPPPLAEGILAAHAQVLREGRPVLDAPIAAEAPGTLSHMRHLLLSCHPVRDATGRIEAVSATVQDVTERARAEASRDLLVNELNHRVKNCLATVQTIARQTLRHAGDDPAAFEQSFSERVRALARAHDLLTARAWQEADLLSVLRAALAPWLDDPRLVLDEGPEVLLRPGQAQALVLAFHELATNAAKYGALTREEGRVRLGWSVDASGMVQLRWAEAGGPRVAPEPARRGFGTRLLEQALRHDLGSGARPEIVFDPVGVRATIHFRPGVLLAPRAPLLLADDRQVAEVEGWNSSSGATSREASPSASA